MKKHINNYSQTLWLIRKASLIAGLLPSLSFAETVSYNFATNPGGLVGTAQIVGGVLQLTTNSNSNVAAFHIPSIADSSLGFKVTFDFTIINSTADNPADGFSFSYGPIPPGTTSNVSEEGWPGISPVISWEFDTYQNNSLEVGVGIAVNDVDLPGAFTNGNLLEGATTVTGTATISLYPVQGASFNTTGLLTNADFVNIATSFVGNDNYTFAFAARTGGANEEVLIDNIVITTGSPDSDNDGLPDDWEILYSLDPNDNGQNPNNNGVPGLPENGRDGDPDSDGLTNLEEFNARTSPRDNDSDDDTLTDGDEVKGLAGLRPPTNPTSADTDGDGLDDFLESNSGVYNGAGDPGTNPTLKDTDNDQTPDRREILKGSNPLDPGQSVVTSSSTIYAQDFDGFPNGTKGTDLSDGSDFHSSAAASSITSDQLLLTRDGDFGVFTSFRIPGITGSSSGWTATFDVILSDTPGNNLPADGFSFSYGAIPPFNPGQADQAASDANGQAEEGWGVLNHISFEVDTWENNAAAPEAGFSIGANQDGADLAIASLTQLPLADGETIETTVTLSWDPVDGASMATTLTGPIFTNAPTLGFTGDDNYIFAFSARTGGATQTAIVDNIVIGPNIRTPLVITEIDVDRTANSVQLSWSSIPGKTYAVDVSTTLEEGDPLDGHWSELASNIGSGGNLTTFTDVSNPNGALKRFYRVREVTTP